MSSSKPKNSIAKTEQNNSNSKKNNLLKNFGFNVPKNVNEYRHIIEIRSTQGSDVEYMLGLRHYNKINRIEKNISTNAPSFYERDLEKYRKKNILKYFDRQLLKTNIATFEQRLEMKKKMKKKIIKIKDFLILIHGIQLPFHIQKIYLILFYLRFFLIQKIYLIKSKTVVEDLSFKLMENMI